MDWLIDEFLRNVLGLERVADVFGVLVSAAFVVSILLCVRVVWAKGTRPNAALAWIATLLALPVVGALFYLIIGENRVGAIRRRRHARIVRAGCAPDSEWKDPRVLGTSMSTADTQMAHLGEASGGPLALGGNRVQLSGDPAEQLRWMVEDIDAAARSADLLFYIFEDDATGHAVSDALVRAAKRGVQVRLLVDSIGSRAFLKSGLRRTLQAAGVSVIEALPASILRLLLKRCDIRNHRKLIVVDGHIAQTGSRNVADPDFKSGGRLGASEPYIDSWIRIRGPVARDLHILFLQDWELDAGFSGPIALPDPPKFQPDGIPVQVIPSGPNFENSVMLSLVQAAIQLARREIVLSTPYFIPDSATLAALEVAARRGLRVTLIVPRANDSMLAALASRANYARMLAAGVELWEHRHGFLHSKTVSIDEEMSIITTGNLDRRSYEINFETSVVVYDDAFAAETRRLQLSYIAESDRMDPRAWAKRGAVARFAENLSNLFSPLL
jgi:cardiolipin synthase